MNELIIQMIWYFIRMYLHFIFPNICLDGKQEQTRKATKANNHSIVSRLMYQNEHHLNKSFSTNVSKVKVIFKA